MANIGAGLAGAASGYATGGITGAILGGVGGLFGGSKKRGPSEDDIRAFNMHATYDHFRSIMGAAKENGIHPIYALGSGFQAPNTAAQIGVDNSAGNGVREAMQMGQDIGSAIYARGTKEQHAAADMMAQQAITKGDLENENLALQNQRLRMGINPPSFPSGSSGQIIEGQQDASSAGIPPEMLAATADTVSGIKQAFQRFNVNGRIVTAPSSDFKNSIEDSPADWYVSGTRTVPTMIAADHDRFVRMYGHKLANLLRRAGRHWLSGGRASR